MAEGRFLSKSVAHDIELASVSIYADCLFLRCIPHLDREGRMPGHPKQVRAVACPMREDMTDEAVARALAELVSVGLVVWYEIDGRQYLQFPGFKKNQKGLREDREAPSKIPGPDTPGAILLLSGHTPDNSGPTPESSGSIPGALPLKLREGKGRGSEAKGSTTQPPPAAPAPAHAREIVAELPAPAGNGGRQAAAPVSAPEWAGTAAQQDPERARLIGEMLAAVEERAREIQDERRRRRFVARSRLIVSGDDLTAWQDGTGRAAPWRERPRLLRLALARTAGEEDPDLRAALRYTVAQQLDPFRPPKANAPPPGSEAARVRDELPRSGGTRTGDLERVGPAPYRPPDDDREERKWDARIERWEAEHPDEAKELLRRVAEEIRDSPLGKGMAGEAMLRTLVRSKYRLEVRKLLEQQQAHEMAGAA